LGNTGPGSATVDQLLGMTAGLAEVPLAAPPTGDSPADLIPVIAAAGLADPPGSAWSYSNPAFGLLGRILEVVGGRNWLDVLSELVLQPVGMTGVAAQEEVTAATASEHVGDEPVDGVDMAAFGAAGTRLWATISDVLRLGSALLRPDAVALRDQQAVVPVPYLADAWCRGLARFDWPEAPAFGWDGIGIGVRNLLRVIPERDVVVALSVNGSRGRLLWNDLIPDVVEAIGGGHVPALRFTPSDAPSDHAPLLGTYERKGLPPAEITTNGSDLLVRDLFGDRVLRHVRGDLYLSNADDADWPTVTLRPDCYYPAGFHFRRV
jgi:CubicO group peptidase (beta-lactamase class C family)